MTAKIMEKIRRITLLQWLLVFGILILFCWCNLAVGVVGMNLTVLINMVVCFLFLYLVAFWGKIKTVKSKWKKFLRNVFLFLVGVLTVCYIGVSISMVVHAARTSQDGNATVIVLGCKINGDQPSLMLARRLDTAYTFLTEHPNAKCVVSGGQGSDEIMPEGEAMKAYLLRKGIEESRVYVENQSTSTQENIEFTLEIIEKESLNKNVVIATDDFHQWRSQMYGEWYGLSCASAGYCATPWYLLPYYWTREVIGAAVTFIVLR